mgnify:CR=1 FL=1
MSNLAAMSPAEIRALYKTAWETSQKELIDMAVERSTFICQSQSLNLFMEDPSIGKLSSMYMYAWKQGIKTTYYLRSRAKTAIKKTTVSSTSGETGGARTGGAPTGTTGNASPSTETQAAGYTPTAAVSCSLENPEACEACQ